MTFPQHSRGPLRWTRYLPALLFLAFFLPNTRLAPLNQYLRIGRWGALVGILALSFLAVRRIHRWPALSFCTMFSFSLLTLTLPYSSNPAISFAKWLVFFLFLVFCLLFASQTRSREEVLLLLRPLFIVFFVFMWATPPAIFVFPQHRYLGFVSGFLVFANALGQFVALFGLPAALYSLEAKRGTRHRLFQMATLGLSVSLIVLSGSRTAAFTMVIFLGVAFWRWKRFQGRLALPVKILAVLVAVLSIPYYLDQVQRFVYKYPGASDVLQSRTSYWEATRESFLNRRWAGSGFGVQETQSDARLSFSSPGAFREQGSTYLGLLEEVGILGTVPILIVLAIVGFKNVLLLFRSRNPLRLLLARSIVAGLIWGASENYLLYLGNAASILVFYALFLQERVAQIERSERIQIRRQMMLAAQLRQAGLDSWQPARA